MITSPTIHLSVFKEPTVTGRQARPLDRPLSPRERFGVFLMFAAVALSLSAALVWADAQPHPARGSSAQTQPRI